MNPATLRKWQPERSRPCNRLVRSTWLINAVGLMLFWLPSLCDAEDKPTNDDLNAIRARNERYKAETAMRKAQARLAEAEAESRDIINAIRNRARSVDEERRARARKQREEIEKNLATEGTRLELMIQAKKWAIQAYAPTVAESNGPERMDAYLRIGNELEFHVKRGGSSDLMSNATSSIKRQLNFTDPAFLREIESGRALNRLLEILAPAATQHRSFLDQLDNGGRERLILEMIQLDASVRADKSKEAFESRVAFIRSLAGKQNLTPEILLELRLENGTNDVRQIIRMNDDPLPLDWPVALRKEDRYLPYMTALEVAKDVAIKELPQVANLQRGSGLTKSTLNRLTSAADDLCNIVDQDFDEFNDALRNRRERTGVAIPVTRQSLEYVRAQRYLREMRMCITRFIEARQKSDIAITFPPIDEATGKQRNVSVQELMAFMSRHALRFAEADVNGKRAYEQIYRDMYDYYVDLEMLRVTARRDSAQLLNKQEELEKAVRAELAPVDATFSEGPVPSPGRNVAP